MHFVAPIQECHGYLRIHCNDSEAPLSSNLLAWPTLTEQDTTDEQEKHALETPSHF